MDVSPNGSMIRRSVDRLLHLVIVREQRPVLASPYSLSPDAAGRNALEQRGREENVVDLVGLGAIAEGPRTPVALKLRMGRNVPKVRPFREQRSQRVAIRRIVEVPDNGNHVDSLRPSQIIDLSDPLSLCFPARVRLSLQAVALALQVIHQEQDARGFAYPYHKLWAVAAENPIAIFHIVDVADYRFNRVAGFR